LYTYLVINLIYRTGLRYLSHLSTLINRDKSPVVESDEVIYAGCYVNASVDIWIQDNNFGKRVNGNLHGVQFVRAGEPFGAGDVDALEDFEALDALTSDDDIYEDVPF
jgi:hypothetical protein